jgi:hypothetical protein
MSRVRQVSKAIAGALAAGLAYAIPVVDDGITLGEGLGIALAVLGGLGIVYSAPRNAPRYTTNLVDTRDPES